MGSLTDIFVAVRSNMTPFEKDTSKGLKKSEKSFEQTGKSVGKLFADAATAAAKSKIEDLGKKASAAAAVQADAAGKVRVAEAKLADVRANGKAKAGQIIAAEEALASAQRKSASASKTAEAATSALEKARSDASAAAGKAGDAAGDSFADRFKKAVRSGNPEGEGQKTGDRFGIGFSQKLPGITGRVTSFFKTGFGAAAGLAAGAIVGGSVVEGFKDALERGGEKAKFQGQLGLTDAQSAKAGKTSGELFKANYGDSVAGVNDAIKSVVQNTNVGLNSVDLKPVTAKVLNLASTFDQDLGGVTRATGQLMRTGLAKNATEALDIITKGFQSGADKSEDFLDTLNEYGTQFRKLGINGATATGIISQGLKAGARDGDLVADALKEFSIRAIDGSDSTRAGFKALGIEADKMSQQIAKGGKPAAAGLDQVLDRLRKVKDPVEQSQIAVQLFGTQAEDLGKALYAIDPSTAVSGLGKVAGAADRLDKTLGSTPAATVSSFFRTLKQNSVESFGGIINAFTTGETKATGFQGVLEKLAVKGKSAFEEIKGGASAFVSAFKANDGDITSSGFPGFMEHLGYVARQTFDFFKAEVLPRLRDFGGYLKDTLIPTIREWAEDSLEKVRGVLGTVKQAIADNRPQLEQLGGTIVRVGKWIAENLIPFLAKVSNETLPILGAAIGRGIHTVGLMVGAFNAWKNTTQTVVTFIWNKLSGFFGDLLDGAATAFGWIPGIGPKLKQAQAAFKKFRDDVNAKLAGINDQEITVTARLNAANIGGKNDNDRRLKGAGYATGGPVFGAGSSTSDSIPAMLSNNEHVWTAKEVRNAGGHAAVESMRAQFRGYATGGAVSVDVRPRTANPGRFAKEIAAHAVAAVRPAAQALANKMFAFSGVPGNVRSFRGERLNELTIARLQNAERLLGRMFHIMQGSYSSRVAASGSTHSGGGAMDTDGPRGWDTAVRALRSSGFAAWHRTPSQGPWGHHIHSIAIGDPSASPAAKAQVRSFQHGGNGLGGMAKGGPVRVYDKGGRWPTGTLGVNLSGKTETVTTGDDPIRLHPRDIDALADAIARRPIMLDGRRVDAAMSGTALGGGF